MTYTFKIARRLSGNHRRFLGLLALSLTLGGCGAATDAVLSEGPGSLVLTIDGLSAGAEAEVVVTGPSGFQRVLNGSRVLSGLQLGTYRVEAHAATSQDNQWMPAEGAQTVVIAQPVPNASVVFHYQLATGSLELRAEGLPPNAVGSFRLTGPGGQVRTVSGTVSSVRGLTPGTWSLALTPQSVGTARYYPDQAVYAVNVVASLSPATLQVRFARKTGGLNLVVDGLPPGASSQYQLRGPGDYQASLTGTTQLAELDPGDYVLTVQPVQWQGHTWAPEAASIPVSVDTLVKTVQIRHNIITGAMDLAVEGLPSGVDADVRVAGPGGFNRTVTGTQAWVGLAPGAYTTTAASVVHGGRRFVPTQASRTCPITPGTTPARCAVTYGETSSAIAVTVNGLPAGVEGRVIIIGANFADTVTTSQTVTGLAAGSYTVIAQPVTTPQGILTPSPLTQVVNVSNGGAVSAAVSYSQAAGALQLGITGLPNGTPAAVVVSGPGGYSQAMTGSGTLSGLAPGTYAIAASNVSEGGTSYLPNPSSQLATVVAGGSVSASVAYATSGPTTGGLSVSITGLPGGTNAAVNVTGPGGYAQAVQGSASLTGLVPGSYTVAASAVTSGGTTYQPSPTSQAVTVTAGANGNAAVAYAAPTPTTGTLNLTVAGLPGGTAAAITLTGPGGFSQAVTASSTLNGLAEGSYTVAAANVTSGGTTYAPTSASQPVWINPGSTASRTVTYAAAAPTTGSLSVTLSGLPGGTAAAVTITGPGSFSQTVTSTTTLNGLSAGSYTIVAANVTAGGSTYLPTPAWQSASVTAGATVSKSVAYAIPAPTTGSLAITVSGLPGGASSAITVSGPGGYSQAVTGTTTLNGLAPGTYTIAAANVAAGGSSYQPTPTSQTAAVTAGGTVAKSVAYAVPAPTTGSLALTIAGLPGGASAAVTVTGPASYSQTVTGTTTLSGLAPGTYTIAAANVTAGGSSYQATPASQTAAVTAGGTVTRSVSYAAAAPTTGNLTLAITGLPGGTAASVTVTGPAGFSQSVTTSGTINGMAEGSYTVTAATVTAGGTTYTPTPASQGVWVGAGATPSRSVAYTGSGGGGGSGPATITVDQGTTYQTMAGWEVTAQAGQEASGYNSWRNTLMTQAADLGINRVRVEIRANAENPTDWFAQYLSGAITTSQWNSHRYEAINDNSNPNSANASGFKFTELDYKFDQVLMPLKSAVEARGERFYVNLNYVAFGTAAGTHLVADEWAELMLVTFQHLQARYGFVPDAIEVILEPDNTTQWRWNHIGNAIVAAGNRLAAAGFHPDFIGPSTISMSNAAALFDQIITVPGATTYLKELSYHRYIGVSDGALATIGARGATYGIRTSMLEHIGSGVEDLYKDLTIGNVSAWQQYTLAYPTTDNGAQLFTISGTTPVMGSRTKLLRQYFKYVPFGSQRVRATSTSSNVRPVAFTTPGGGMAVVIHVDAAGSYSVAGMRPGTYSVTMTTGSGTLIQLPAVTATSGGSVTIVPTQTGVLTLSRQ
ncbi:MAG: hypothetical protein AB7V35_09515 [Gemmatimonadales bacterium]